MTKAGQLINSTRAHTSTNTNTNTRPSQRHKFSNPTTGNKQPNTQYGQRNKPIANQEHLTTNGNQPSTPPTKMKKPSKLTLFTNIYQLAIVGIYVCGSVSDVDRSDVEQTWMRRVFVRRKTNFECTTSTHFWLHAGVAQGAVQCRNACCWLRVCVGALGRDEHCRVFGTVRLC